MALLNRSSLYAAALLLLVMAGCSEAGDAPGRTAEAAGDVRYALYKSPSCGCCEHWQQHLSEAHFVADVRYPDDLNAVKTQLGIAPRYQSCHTAVFDGGYVFEGHVPVKHIRRFLDNPPDNALGLAAPGMPLGSPGMEVDGRFTPYDILLLRKDGSSEVYARINAAHEQY